MVAGEPERITYDVEEVMVPVVVVRYARYLLTLSSAMPELRVATIDALDLALAKHEAREGTP